MVAEGGLSLPPRVRGDVCGSLRFRCGPLVGDSGRAGEGLVVRVKWWGQEERAAAPFVPGGAAHCYDLRCGPDEFSQYLRGMKSLPLQVMRENTGELVAECSVDVRDMALDAGAHNVVSVYDHRGCELGTMSVDIDVDYENKRHLKSNRNKKSVSNSTQRQRAVGKRAVSSAIQKDSVNAGYNRVGDAPLSPKSNDNAELLQSLIDRGVQLRGRIDQALGKKSPSKSTTQRAAESFSRQSQVSFIREPHLLDALESTSANDVDTDALFAELFLSGSPPRDRIRPVSPEVVLPVRNAEKESEDAPKWNSSFPDYEQTLRNQMNDVQAIVSRSASPIPSVVSQSSLKYRFEPGQLINILICIDGAKLSPVVGRDSAAYHASYQLFPDQMRIRTEDSLSRISPSFQFHTHVIPRLFSERLVSEKFSRLESLLIIEVWRSRVLLGLVKLPLFQLQSTLLENFNDNRPDHCPSFALRHFEADIIHPLSSEKERLRGKLRAAIAIGEPEDITYLQQLIAVTVTLQRYVRGFLVRKRNSFGRSQSVSKQSDVANPSLGDSLLSSQAFSIPRESLNRSIQRDAGVDCENHAFVLGLTSLDGGQWGESSALIVQYVFPTELHVTRTSPSPIVGCRPLLRGDLIEHTVRVPKDESVHRILLDSRRDLVFEIIGVDTKDENKMEVLGLASISMRSISKVLEQDGAIRYQLLVRQKGVDSSISPCYLTLDMRHRLADSGPPASLDSPESLSSASRVSPVLLQLELTTLEFPRGNVLSVSGHLSIEVSLFRTIEKSDEMELVSPWRSTGLLNVTREEACSLNIGHRERFLISDVQREFLCFNLNCTSPVRIKPVTVASSIVPLSSLINGDETLWLSGMKSTCAFDSGDLRDVTLDFTVRQVAQPSRSPRRTKALVDAAPEEGTDENDQSDISVGLQLTAVKPVQVQTSDGTLYLSVRYRFFQDEDWTIVNGGIFANDGGIDLRHRRSFKINAQLKRAFEKYLRSHAMELELWSSPYLSGSPDQLEGKALLHFASLFDSRNGRLRDHGLIGGRFDVIPSDENYDKPLWAIDARMEINVDPVGDVSCLPTKAFSLVDGHEKLATSAPGANVGMHVSIQRTVGFSRPQTAHLARSMGIRWRLTSSPGTPSGKSFVDDADWSVCETVLNIDESSNAFAYAIWPQREFLVHVPQHSAATVRSLLRSELVLEVRLHSNSPSVLARCTIPILSLVSRYQHCTQAVMSHLTEGFGRWFPLTQLGADSCKPQINVFFRFDRLVAMEIIKEVARLKGDISSCCSVAIKTNLEELTSNSSASTLRPMVALSEPLVRVPEKYESFANSEVVESSSLFRPRKTSAENRSIESNYILSDAATNVVPEREFEAETQIEDIGYFCDEPYLPIRKYSSVSDDISDAGDIVNYQGVDSNLALKLRLGIKDMEDFVNLLRERDEVVERQTPRRMSARSRFTAAPAASHGSSHLENNDSAASFDSMVSHSMSKSGLGELDTASVSTAISTTNEVKAVVDEDKDASPQIADHPGNSEKDETELDEKVTVSNQDASFERSVEASIDIVSDVSLTVPMEVPQNEESVASVSLDEVGVQTETYPDVIVESVHSQNVDSPKENSHKHIVDEFSRLHHTLTQKEQGMNRYLDERKPLTRLNPDEAKEIDRIARILKGTP